MTKQLTASQTESVRAIDAILAKLGQFTNEPISTIRQVDFRLIRTKHESDGTTSTEVHLQGNVWYGQKQSLESVEVFLDLTETGHLEWETRFASIMIGKLYFAFCDVQTFDGGRRIEAKVEQHSITRFPR